ncbi:hypothetical protein HZS_1136 [Henneguya salminicola]|nr:hypothetical protein HZS_1136 [Henneguya salminicola]
MLCACPLMMDSIAEIGLSTSSTISIILFHEEIQSPYSLFLDILDQKQIKYDQILFADIHKISKNQDFLIFFQPFIQSDLLDVGFITNVSKCLKTGASILLVVNNDFDIKNIKNELEFSGFVKFIEFCYNSFKIMKVFIEN